jgi:hypothetical protein
LSGFFLLVISRAVPLLFCRHDSQSTGRRQLQAFLDSVEAALDAVHAERLTGEIAVEVGDLGCEGRNAAPVLAEHFEDTVRLLVNAPKVNEKHAVEFVSHASSVGRVG